MLSPALTGQFGAYEAPVECGSTGVGAVFQACSAVEMQDAVAGTSHLDPVVVSRKAPRHILMRRLFVGGCGKLPYSLRVTLL
jgi:hypothetical protein